MTQHGKCDFITFVIDFAGVWFSFLDRFIASWSTEKNMTFMTLNGPSYQSAHTLWRQLSLRVAAKKMFLLEQITNELARTNSIASTDIRAVAPFNLPFV